MVNSLDKQIEDIIDRIIKEKEKEIAEQYETIYKEKIEKELHRIEMRYINNIPQYASIGKANKPKYYWL